MFKYKNKFMTNATMTELEELMNNGHEEAITAFAKEIQNATLEGYCDGIANATIKVAAKGVVAGGIMAMLLIAAFDIGIGAYEELKERKNNKEIQDEKLIGV